MVFLSIILCVLNIQAQSHFKLYKSEGHFYLNGEMNETHVDRSFWRQNADGI